MSYPWMQLQKEPIPWYTLRKNALRGSFGVPEAASSACVHFLMYTAGVLFNELLELVSFC